MTNILHIFRRELQGQLGHPLAYVALALYVVMLAAFALFFADLLNAGVASMKTPFFWIATGFLFLVPAVTMRTVAEETRSGRLELLATLPLTEAQLILGKWLAAVAVVAAALVLTLPYPFVLSQLGDLDWGPVIGGYVGLLLMGSSFSAIGVAASSVTTNQLVAFQLALTVCVLPWAVGFFLPVVPVEYLPWVQYLAFEYHFSNLARGVLDTRSLVFFGSIAVLALRLAMLSLEHRRLT